MLVQYPTHHRWRKPVVEDPITLFGKSARSKLRSTLSKIEATDVSTLIEPITPEFLEWFSPFYESHINQKNNPSVANIRKRVLEEPKFDYFSLSLYEGEERVGATIFSSRKDRLAIAYRTYNYEWQNAALPANPSLYTEYVVCMHAFKIGKKWVGHGKDRNPYGKNANIGLAIFKLSTGNQPAMVQEAAFDTLETDSLDEDALILLPPQQSKQVITSALLITKPENEEKYAQVTKYPELICVEVLYRQS